MADMPTPILGNSMTTGLSMELLRMFPGITVYREQLSNPALIQFPHVFVEQLTQSINEELKGKFWLHYLMTVRYRINAEPTTVFNLQSQLDSVGLQLMEMKYIPLATKILPVRNKRTEKIDGVCHFFANFDFRVTEPEVEPILMWNLEQSRKLKPRFELKNP